MAVKVKLSEHFHELASLFPKVVGAEREALKENIRTQGINVPVVLYQGQVLDGCNRVEIAEELGIEVPTTEFEGTDVEAMAYVISLNLQRRQLNTSQRAAVAVAAGKLDSKYKKAAGVELPEENDGDRAERIAKDCGTNRTYIFQAQQIFEKSKPVFRQVLSGELTIPEARRKMRQKDAEESAEETNGKADGKSSKEAERVIYDTLEQKVPKHLHECFNAAETFKEATGLLRQAKKKAADEINGKPGGAFINLTGVNTAIDTALREFRDARPYAVCPACKGEKCPACKRKGYMSEPLYKAFEAAEKAAKEEAGKNGSK